jgi:leucine-zipper of insertion element IS481
MKAHKNARTTHHSRQILVERVAQELPAWQVPQDLGISRHEPWRCHCVISV